MTNTQTYLQSMDAYLGAIKLDEVIQKTIPK